LVVSRQIRPTELERSRQSNPKLLELSKNSLLRMGFFVLVFLLVRGSDRVNTLVEKSNASLDPDHRQMVTATLDAQQYSSGMAESGMGPRPEAQKA
jgi:hypothetical protein